MTRLLITPALALVIGVTALTHHGSAQNDSRDGRNAREDPTTVVPGPFTESQRASGRVFSRHKLLNANRSLLESIDPAGGGVELGVPERRPDKAYYSRSFRQFFADTYRDAEMVVIGQPVSKRAEFTDDYAWIVTHYEFLAREVVKPDGELAVARDDIVRVTNPSGTVQVEGRVISATDDTHFPFEVNGPTYLLFLKYSADLGAYIPIDRYGAFRLDADAVTPMTLEPLPLHFGPDAKSPPLGADELMRLIRALKSDASGETGE